MKAGTAANRLMKPMIRKSPCMELMKCPSSTVFTPPVAPENMAWRTAVGTLAAMTANARPRLSRNPVFTRVDDMPEAIPLLGAGVAFIMEATLGATNRPPPAPASSMGGSSWV